jgi:hypothetical protein
VKVPAHVCNRYNRALRLSPLPPPAPYPPFHVIIYLKFSIFWQIFAASNRTQVNDHRYPYKLLVVNAKRETIWMSVTGKA